MDPFRSKPSTMLLRTAAVATAAAAMSLSGPAAHAAVIETGTDVIKEDIPITCDYGTPDESDDIDILLKVRGTQNYTLKTRGPDEFVYFKGQGTQRISVSIPGTGIDWYADESWVEHDLRVVSQDGTRFTIEVGRNNHVRVVDPDGNPYKAGNTDSRVEWTMVVNTAGGDDEFLGQDKLVGRIGTNACEDARTFTS